MVFEITFNEMGGIHIAANILGTVKYNNLMSRPRCIVKCGVVWNGMVRYGVVLCSAAYCSIA